MFVVTGAVYLFGQMSSRGEANMYPKPVQDLHGWNLRSIGTCSIGLVAAADDSCIVWGSGTSSGELVIHFFFLRIVNKSLLLTYFNHLGSWRIEKIQC